jgi:hypothetical protein
MLYETRQHNSREGPQIKGRLSLSGYIFSENTLEKPPPSGMTVLLRRYPVKSLVIIPKNLDTAAGIPFQ